MHGMPGGILAPSLSYQLGIEGLFLCGGMRFDVMIEPIPSLPAISRAFRVVSNFCQKLAVFVMVFLDGLVDRWQEYPPVRVRC